MKHIFKLLFLIFLSSTVFAQEDYRAQGFYAGVLGGVNLKAERPVRDAFFHPGFLTGVSAGYKFCNNLRLEGELSYKRNELRNSRKSYDSSAMFMANVIYDFDSCTRWTPFIGFGVGYAYNKSQLLYRTGFWDSMILINERHCFACQSIVGIAYKISKQDEIDLQYRCINSGSSADNAVALSLRHYF